jgi:putative hydrolase of the HAD superfamily
MTVLVLDLDGVVVLGHPDGGRWDKDLARDLGMDPERVQTRFFRAHFRRAVLGEADLFEILDTVWPELQGVGTPRGFVEYWFTKDSRVDPDVLALIDGWRADGGKAYLATVQEHHRARHVWETIGLSRHFDGMHHSAALGAAKPDPEFYRRAHAKLPAATPSEVLFLDDRLDNIEAAAAFGWRARHYRGIDDLRRALSDLA